MLQAEVARTALMLWRSLSNLSLKPLYTIDYSTQDTFTLAYMKLKGMVEPVMIL